MAEGNDRARQQFLADIILELTRQQQEDSDVFNGIQKSTNEQLFRKLCFDFPVISESDWNQISYAVDNVLRISCTTSSFYNEFYLHDKFIENALNRCDIASTETENLKQNTKIATTLYFLLPTCLLQSPTSRLTKLLKSNNDKLTWNEVLNYFHDFIKQSTISTICNNISKDTSLQDNNNNNNNATTTTTTTSTATSTTLVLLQEKDYIDVLCQAVSSLGRWIVETELILEHSNSNNTTTISSNSTDSKATITEESEQGKEGEVDIVPTENIIDLNKELGIIQQHTNTSTTNTTTMLDMLNNLIKQSKTNEHNMKILLCVYNIIKPCWLHMTLFIRDIFIQYPILSTTKINIFLSALKKSDTNNNNNNNNNNLVNIFNNINIKSKLFNFPSTNECIYVVILSSLCSHYSNFIKNTMNISYIVSILHAKKTLRTYLNQNLTCFIDICTRMHINNNTINANKSDTKQEKIDLEVTGFLIDIAMIYSSDPSRAVSAAAATTTTSMSSTSTVPALVAARLLPLLLSTLCSILQQQQQLEQSSADSVEQEGSSSTNYTNNSTSGSSDVLSTPAFYLIYER